jgi:hypothetical protein
MNKKNIYACDLDKDITFVALRDSACHFAKE